MAEQLVPAELQQPPTFTDTEASAVLQFQAEIAATRLDAEGNQVYGEYVMGVTYDGTVVSVDEQFSLADDHFVVRVGGVSQLAEGIQLSEQRMAYNSEGVMRMRDGGTTLIESEFGDIGISAPRRGELPRFGGKILFPFGEDGKPFLPAAMSEAETAATGAELESDLQSQQPVLPESEQEGVDQGDTQVISQSAESQASRPERRRKLGKRAAKLLLAGAVVLGASWHLVSENNAAGAEHDRQVAEQVEAQNKSLQPAAVDVAKKALDFVEQHGEGVEGSAYFGSIKVTQNKAGEMVANVYFETAAPGTPGTPGKLGGRRAIEVETGVTGGKPDPQKVHGVGGIVAESGADGHLKSRNSIVMERAPNDKIPFDPLYGEETPEGWVADLTVLSQSFNTVYYPGYSDMKVILDANQLAGKEMISMIVDAVEQAPLS